MLAVVNDAFSEAGLRGTRGWLADALHPEQVAGGGQGIELAAGAKRPDLDCMAMRLYWPKTEALSRTDFLPRAYALLTREFVPGTKEFHGQDHEEGC
jgi:hypothetical protein